MLYDRVEYRVNGILHRINGPASAWFEGDWFWFRNGIPHRYYGPASSIRALDTTAFMWEIHGVRIK